MCISYQLHNVPWYQHYQCHCAAALYANCNLTPYSYRLLFGSEHYSDCALRSPLLRRRFFLLPAVDGMTYDTHPRFASQGMKGAATKVYTSG